MVDEREPAPFEELVELLARWRRDNEPLIARAAREAEEDERARTEALAREAFA